MKRSRVSTIPWKDSDWGFSLIYCIMPIVAIWVLSVTMKSAL